MREVPRVADLVRRAAGAELVGVGVADEHGAARTQPAPRHAVLRGDVILEDAAGARERQSTDADEVLHADRDAAERGCVLAVTRTPFVGLPRLRACDGGVEADPGVDGERGAV